MKLPNIPTPDDLIYLFLALVVGQSIILWLILTILKLRSWYRTFRDGMEKGKAAIGLTKEIIARMRRMRRVGLVLVMTSSVMMLFADGMWVLVNYIIGNILSGVVGLNRGLHILEDSDVVPTWSQFVSLLRLDAISEGYILLSLVGLAASYVHARRRTSADYIGHLFGLPGYLYGFCGLVGGALSLGINLLSHGSYISVRWVIFMLGAGIAGSLYVITCLLVVNAPTFIEQMWSDRSQADRLAH